MCSLLKKSLEICTPILQMYTEKNHGALYVHYHKLITPRAFRVFINGLQYYYFLNYKFKCPCTGDYVSEAPLLHGHQSKEIFKMKVVPQLLFSVLKFVKS